MGSRRKARELALQFLYKVDVSGGKADSFEIVTFLHDFGGKDEDTDYAVILIENSINHMPEIDASITAHLENWTLDRLSSIDRNILRFATCELLYFLDIPLNVTINEAIEIAKKFSLEESATFINGVLDKIAKKTRKVKAQ